MGCGTSKEQVKQINLRFMQNLSCTFCFANIHSCADQAGIVREHGQEDATISKKSQSSRVHPCVEGIHPANISVAPEDAAKGSPVSNPPRLGLGHEPGHAQEPANIPEIQSAGHKHENFVTEGDRKGCLYPPKAAASYGINRREVT